MINHLPDRSAWHVELDAEGVECAIQDENGAVDEEEVEASSMASCWVRVVWWLGLGLGVRVRVRAL